MSAILLSAVGVSSIPQCLHTATLSASEMFTQTKTKKNAKFAKFPCMSERWSNSIAFWREKAGLTQEALAFALDPPTTKGTISQYESGKRKPSQGRLEEIAQVLGTSRGSLLDGQPSEAAPAPPRPEQLSEDTWIALLAFAFDADMEDRVQLERIRAGQAKGRA